MDIDKNKLTAIVLFGGESVEHDVSIITGIQFMHAMDSDRFNIVPIYIDKENHWLMSKEFMNIATFAKGNLDSATKVCLYDGNLFKMKRNGMKKLFKVDFAFSAMHGGVGENGAMAGFMEVVGIPYSFSGLLPSSMTYNKYYTKVICEKLSVRVVEYFYMTAGTRDVSCEMTFPLIVKPCSLGSSVGITFCRNDKELQEAIDFAFLFDSEILIERALTSSRELNISVMRSGDKILLSEVEEVGHSRDFLTFEDKYMDNGQINGSDARTIPADISPSVKKGMENMAYKVYSALHLKGIVRMDFILDGEELYLNEVNSIPGSMANYLWTDVSYKTLINKMYDSAMEEYEKNRKKIKNFSTSILTKFSSSGKENYKK